MFLCFSPDSDYNRVFHLDYTKSFFCNAVIVLHIHGYINVHLLCLITVKMMLFILSVLGVKDGEFCLSVFLWGIQTQLTDSFCWTEFLRSSGTITPLLWLNLNLDIDLWHMYRALRVVFGHISSFWNCSEMHLCWYYIMLFYSSYLSISTCISTFV